MVSSPVSGVGLRASLLRGRDTSSIFLRVNSAEAGSGILGVLGVSGWGSLRSSHVLIFHLRSGKSTILAALAGPSQGLPRDSSKA